ncbi:restriction endonuclease [Roseinatronobacter alkalisoli]|uniref:Restriction endonuclease n=1 Tax=Roseinatronobacter alkalisoli TaxID=3028235 RepID=A0ABT5TDY9_9RHOB|nr:restriction endonuclease [Roseinatronobacter sp. HJB301]MDD7973331.1 restriction endonuclease [Roseinatronobacter sp. HJB301]
MPVPDFQTLIRPVLQLFSEGKTSVKECIEPLKERLGITEEDAQETLQSGQTVLYNRAHWARTYLGKAGMLESPRRGTHLITQQGRDFLLKAPDRITISDLKEYHNFLDWHNQTAGAEDEADSSSTLEALEDAASLTPEDIIENAKEKIDLALAEELISALFQMSPIGFEKLILDLLQAMGFGRGKAEYKRLTPATGDGGIDGVINEDALGLDAVYIQAKRYAENNKVSRPDIQRFVGSLTGESATKGVFVTTSDFSREAVAYIDRIQQRVVLINGKTLARLMIEYDVGVRVRSVVKIKSLDEDYFSER